MFLVQGIPPIALALTLNSASRVLLSLDGEQRIVAIFSCALLVTLDSWLLTQQWEQDLTLWVPVLCPVGVFVIVRLTLFTPYVYTYRSKSDLWGVLICHARANFLWGTTGPRGSPSRIHVDRTDWDADVQSKDHSLTLFRNCKTWNSSSSRLVSYDCKIHMIDPSHAETLKSSELDLVTTLWW